MEVFQMSLRGTSGLKGRMRRFEKFGVLVVGLASILILFLLAPIVAIFLLADPKVIQESLFTNAMLASEAWSALLTTLKASITSTLILLALGVPLAYVLARKEFRGKYFIEGLLDVPLMLPHAVAGIMILTAYGRGGIFGPVTGRLGLAVDDSFWGIVAAMAFVSAPILVDTVKVGIESLDPMLELVARSLGASQAKVFTSITLPLVVRSVCVGSILSWARAMSEVGAILIVAYYPKTVNVLVIEWFNSFGLSYAIALSIPLVLLSLSLFVVVRWVLRK